MKIYRLIEQLNKQNYFLNKKMDNLQEIIVSLKDENLTEICKKTELLDIGFKSSGDKLVSFVNFFKQNHQYHALLCRIVNNYLQHDEKEKETPETQNIEVIKKEDTSKCLYYYYNTKTVMVDNKCVPGLSFSDFCFKYHTY